MGIIMTVLRWCNDMMIQDETLFTVYADQYYSKYKYHMLFTHIDSQCNMIMR